MGVAPRARGPSCRGTRCRNVSRRVGLSAPTGLERSAVVRRTVEVDGGARIVVEDPRKHRVLREVVERPPGRHVQVHEVLKVRPWLPAARPSLPLTTAVRGAACRESARPGRTATTTATRTARRTAPQRTRSRSSVFRKTRNQVPSCDERRWRLRRDPLDTTLYTISIATSWPALRLRSTPATRSCS